MENIPTDFFVKSSAFTKTVHRDQYPAIDPTNDALSQSGKVIMVTGASAGIGARGTVPAYAKAGAKAIIMLARGHTKLEAVAADLRAQYPNTEFLALSAATNDQPAVEKVFAEIKSKHSHIDVLVNNAGYWASGGALIKDASPSDWWEDFDINVKGTFLITQAFLKLLGTERHGTVITMNSGTSTLLQPGLSSYSISKNASLKLNEYFALEHPNVTAISLQPGLVPTDSVTPEFKYFALDTVELTGGTCVWLSTGAAKFLSGRYISANWDMEELKSKEKEVVASDDLKMVYQGKFGI